MIPRVGVMEGFRKRKRFHCLHCDCYLTKSAYYCHKRKFYDPISKLWKPDESGESSEETTDSGIVEDNTFE